MPKIPTKEQILSTPGRRIVFESLMNNLGVKEAAKRANLGRKYVQNWVAKSGCNALVKAEQEKILAKTAKKLEVNKERVIKELARVGFSDVSKILDENGNMAALEAIPEDQRRAISSVEIFEEYQGKGENREFIGYTKKVKFWDKVKALEDLGKHFGIFEADNTQKGRTLIELVALVGAERRKCIDNGNNKASK